MIPAFILWDSMALPEDSSSLRLAIKPWIVGKKGFQIWECPNLKVDLVAGQ